MTISIDMQHVKSLLQREFNGMYEHLGEARKAHSRLWDANPTTNLMAKPEVFVREMRHHQQMAREHLIRANAILEAIGECPECAPSNWEDLSMVIDALESNFPA